MDWKYLLTSFEGRINRAKFWAGVAVLIAISIVLNLVDMLLGLQLAQGVGILGSLFAIALIFSAVATWLIVECGILERTRGPNRFGPDPLA